MKSLLVVLNGPIGSGKTTVSVAVAGLIERSGHRSATIDIDEVWAMVEHQRPRKGGPAAWTLSRRGVAALADEFFDDGVDVVIVNGPFYEPSERAELIQRLKTPVDVRYVTLTVSFEEALRRTNADPDVHRRDVHIRAAKERADAADEPRLVLVLRQQEMAVDRDIDPEAVDADDARLAADDRPADRRPADRDLEQARVAGLPGLAALDDVEPARFRFRERVHEIHPARLERLEHAL